MNITDIITVFKSHQLQYGLDGDSKQEELYKWKLVTKQKGHPDPDAKDFAREISSLDFTNLCYGYQISAVRHFVEYAPEDYRQAFKGLFDENVDLQQRVETFISTCKALWNDKIKSHFDKKTRAMCDERLTSCFLTFHNPKKYTFYKPDVYGELCKSLGIKKKKPGQKLVHFYELLQLHVIPLVENDKDLVGSINEELQKAECIQSLPLIAQTALWNCLNHRENIQTTASRIQKEKTMKYKTYIELLEESHNLVLTGAPGTGKTFMAQAIAKEMGCTKEEMCFVQFHPSYDYTDFVEGLRPVESPAGQIGFERKDGVFKEFCKKAIKSLVDSQTVNNVERRPFVFIIDEINRGEASKIFGELFYAIDPGYRGKKDVRVKTQYQNLVPGTDVFAEGFYVPENVYILATMNDIDRSVESMDFAMRRRFIWKEITPSDTQNMLDGLDCADEAKAAMNRLNKAVTETEGLGADYQVGPSCFLRLGTNGGDFQKLWNMSIEPLLKEYLRGFRNAANIMIQLRSAYFGTRLTESEHEN